MPTSASGTTTNVTTGIASALASGETSDTCWNSASVPGTSADRHERLRARRGAQRAQRARARVTAAAGSRRRPTCA